MTEKQANLCTELERLGFTQGSRMRLYGEEFELLSGPIAVGENAVFVDATEKSSGRSRYLRIPLLIMKMANHDRVSARAVTVTQYQL
jgi:hypothetical protein